MSKYQENLKKKYSRKGVSLEELMNQTNQGNIHPEIPVEPLQEKPKTDKTELTILRKIKKQVETVILVWKHYRSDEKRLNKEMDKLEELTYRSNMIEGSINLIDEYDKGEL